MTLETAIMMYPFVKACDSKETKALAKKIQKDFPLATVGLNSEYIKYLTDCQKAASSSLVGAQSLQKQANVVTKMATSLTEQIQALDVMKANYTESLKQLHDTHHTIGTQLQSNHPQDNPAALPQMLSELGQKPYKAIAKSIAALGEAQAAITSRIG